MCHGPTVAFQFAQRVAMQILQATDSHGSRWSISDLVQRHQQFLSRSWKDVPLSEIARQFTETYGSGAMITMALKPDQIGSGPLHRARWIDAGSEDLSDLRTYSY